MVGHFTFSTNGTSQPLNKTVAPSLDFLSVWVYSKMTSQIRTLLHWQFTYAFSTFSFLKELTLIKFLSNPGNLLIKCNTVEKACIKARVKSLVLQIVKSLK